jgi:hypothetical protein
MSNEPVVGSPLSMDYQAPEFAPPHRVLVLAASTEGWYASPADERARVLDALNGLFQRVIANGARLVGSFDDDLFVTGQPTSLPYSIYAIFDVDDLGVIVAMVHELRTELGHVLRLEARVGRPLFLLEN